MTAIRPRQEQPAPPAVTNATRALVRDVYAAFATRDPERIARFFADDIDWDFAAPIEIFPFAGPRHGVAAVVRVFAEHAANYDTTRYVPETVLVDGDKASAYVAATFRHRVTGRMFTGHMAEFMRFHNGRIASFRGFSDTVGVVEQALGHDIADPAQPPQADLGAPEPPPADAIRDASPDLPDIRALVQAAYDAWQRRDPARIARFIHDDVDWLVGGPRHVLPQCRPMHGRDAVLRAFAESAALFDDVRQAFEMTLVDGDRASQLVHLAGRHRPSGQFLAGRQAQFMTFRNGRLIRFRGIIDALEAVEQLMGHHVDVPKG